MHFRPHKAAVQTVVGAALIVCGGVAAASNGLNDLAYGAESAGTAGADLALARDTFALNTNPAGLTQIQGSMLDLLVQPWSWLRTGHHDSLGNDDNPDARLGGLVAWGYAQRLRDHDLVLGVGGFVQGGAGSSFGSLNNVYGTTDQLSLIFGTVKLAPGIAWRVNEQLSLGASLGLLYSAAREKLLYETSTAEFSGLRIDDLAGVSGNIKLGLQYRPSSTWVLALTYTSKAPIKLEDGELRLNATGSGLGVVHYRDAEIKGLGFAQELGLGVWRRLNDEWAVTADLSWLDWSESMSQGRIRARHPDNPNAPPTLPIDVPLSWRDQYLLAVGALYQYGPDTELRFGASYARNPMPRATMTPVLLLFGETSFCVGLSQRMGAHWTVQAALAYQLLKAVNYDSDLFGPSRDRFEGTILYLGFNRRW